MTTTSGRARAERDESSQHAETHTSPWKKAPTESTLPAPFLFDPAQFEDERDVRVFTNLTDPADEMGGV